MSDFIPENEPMTVEERELAKIMDEITIEIKKLDKDRLDRLKSYLQFLRFQGESK